MQKLEEVLKNYDIEGEIVNRTKGPLLEIIEFLPIAGTKLKTII